jgi:hypothetical protein
MALAFNAIQDARHRLCGHAICASALGDERVEAVQHRITCTSDHWPSPRAALAAAAHEFTIARSL